MKTPLRIAFEKYFVETRDYPVGSIDPYGDYIDITAKNHWETFQAAYTLGFNIARRGNEPGRTG